MERTEHLWRRRMNLAVSRLLDDLEQQAVMFEGMAARAADGKDPMRVGVFGAWASATRQCLAIVRIDMPAVIDEAQLVPDPEPDREAVFGLLPGVETTGATLRAAGAQARTRYPGPDREVFCGTSGMDEESRERCPSCGHHDGYHADDC